MPPAQTERPGAQAPPPPPARPGTCQDPQLPDPPTAAPLTLQKTSWAGHGESPLAPVAISGACRLGRKGSRILPTQRSACWED